MWGDHRHTNTTLTSACADYPFPSGAMTTYRGSNINIDDGWYVQQSNDPVEKDEVTQNKGSFFSFARVQLLGRE